ncbi:MAG: GTP cyclohydrolase I FolE [Gammaproteobacteria bacterium]|nr:GTP cyclohydrolase I FolE [Gammaproteobacteria bacterium]MCP4089756.1 GTP cyclohydrolase I FolE [Gammaproteobacteria bacterium]MCP4278227.1 GTP cyclohydrolase I FolE [Gammaproteobacteria bacterium]MCP4831946.1 GTP cyclohydrolase I FolE [Gammaproteobacteria bacterium]MCP4927582.1 GTP cyclohydrolase I FolE [Gammaproteobacteria bacterium]
MTKEKENKPTLEAAEAAVRTLLDWIGEDPDRKGLVRTPARVIKSFGDWYSGYDEDPAAILGSSFPDAGAYKDMVALVDINFESHCEHHMAPFIGMAHVAYVPDGRVVGVSKIVKVVNAFAKRLQVQEKLTQQIADCINDELKPKGVAVVLQASHECMTTRGVYKNNIRMVTSAMLGCFQDNEKVRTEFLSMIDAKTA